MKHCLLLIKYMSKYMSKNTIDMENLIISLTSMKYLHKNVKNMC